MSVEVSAELDELVSVLVDEEVVVSVLVTDVEVSVEVELLVSVLVEV